MANKYFGTDGIRGQANVKLTPDLALKVGQAAGLALRRGGHRQRVVIGNDTRISSYMIEGAMIAGFTSVGADVVLLDRPHSHSGVSQWRRVVCVVILA
jgi:phosphoglucosamine mutase